MEERTLRLYGHAVKDGDGKKTKISAGGKTRRRKRKR
jgi:hypothetical protein